MTTGKWQTIPAKVVQGHRVASGLNGNARFPGGTLHMQRPYFLERGLDLSPFYMGTLNLSIAPWHYRIGTPKLTLKTVRWHRTEPAEDFSFLDARVAQPGGPQVVGLIYYPHPDTKPAHFQQPDVLELLLPLIGGLEYGAAIELSAPEDQILFDPQTPRETTGILSPA